MLINKIKYRLKRTFRFTCYDRIRLFEFDKQRRVKRSFFEKAGIVFTRKNVIPFMDIDVTTICNLRCKRCGKCTPYFEKKHNFSAQEIKENLELLERHVDKIYYASIIGGEPFLNPELAQIIEIISQSKKIMNLELTTNGTVVPSDELLTAIKKSGLAVHISRYPNLSEKLTNNRIRLEEKLKEYGIFYEYQFIEDWLDFGDIKKRSFKKIQLKNMFLNCPMNTCTVFNGKKLYRCGKASYISQHSMEEDGQDIIKLDEIKSRRDMKKKLKKFFSCKYLPACSYCEEFPQTIIAGGQIENQVDYDYRYN